MDDPIIDQNDGVLCLFPILQKQGKYLIWKKEVPSSYLSLEIILIHFGPNITLGKITEIISISTYSSRNR